MNESTTKTRRKKPKLSHSALGMIYELMEFYSFFDAKEIVRKRGGLRRVPVPTERELAQKAAETQVSKWNAQHPVGTPVALRALLDGPEIMSTRTRSMAWVIGGHASVLVEGRSGGYGLNWLRVLHDTTWTAPTVLEEEVR